MSNLKSPTIPFQATTKFSRVNVRGAATALSFIGLSAFQMMPAPAKAISFNLDISKSEVIKDVNEYVAGMKIKIDNWDTFKKVSGGAWNTNNTYIRLPEKMGGKKINFDLKPFHIATTKYPNKNPKKKWYAYVDEMNGDVAAGMQGSLVTLSAKFESQGKEIKIGCEKWWKKKVSKKCPWHVLEHTGNINNAKALIKFSPEFEGSTVILKPQGLTLDADISADSKLFNKLFGSKSKFINAYDYVLSLARQKANSVFMQEFSKPSTQRAMSQAINNQIMEVANEEAHERGIPKDSFKITNIQDAGSSYKITVKFDTPSNSNSSSSGSNSSPSVASLSLSKPSGDKCTFKSTIKVVRKVGGKVWLQHQRGPLMSKQNGPKFAWKMNSAGSKTSSIGNPFGNLLPRSRARILVSYKDINGKPQIKTSKWRRFSSSCRKQSQGIKGIQASS